MRKVLFSILFFLILKSISFSQIADVIKVKGVINPVITQYIERGIKHAEEQGAECLIIELDTPGGLDKSMRAIIGKIYECKIPIVVYVYPPSSRAASAGVFITMASDFAVMAPSTNIGAAHPVNLGGKIDKEMSDKITHDAAAYIRTIAERKGRNISWAEQAVRKSLSLTEKEALKKKVIDFVATDLRDLLKKLDGKKVKGKILKTKGAKINFVNMNFREKFLHDISDPNIAYILMMLAVYGLIYELANPGAILPGVVGGICLILAFFALESLPINLAGIFLIIFAIILFIADIKAPSHGILTVGGIISLTLGSFMLFSSSGPYLTVKVSSSLIIATVLFTTFFFVFALTMGVKALRAKVTSGIEGIVGKTGVAKTHLSPFGIVLIEGEDWNAESIEGEIKGGEKVKVSSVEGLKLKVKKY